MEAGYNEEDHEARKVQDMVARLDFNEKKDRLIINELLKPWKPTAAENANFDLEDIGNLPFKPKGNEGNKKSELSQKLLSGKPSENELNAEM